MPLYVKVVFTLAVYFFLLSSFLYQYFLFGHLLIGELFYIKRIHSQLKAPGYNPANTLVRRGTMQLHIGCSGWSYSAWPGHFYPKLLDPRNYLSYYSKVFDYVEIDYSFYETPGRFMTERWAKQT